MPSYVVLTGFTQPGTGNVEECPGRTEDAIDLIESLGGELWEFFAVMGRYDEVVIADVPDNKTAAQAVLALGKSGNITTETPNAFDLDAFREIVADIEGVR